MMQNTTSYEFINISRTPGMMKIQGLFFKLVNILQYTVPCGKLAILSGCAPLLVRGTQCTEHNGVTTLFSWYLCQRIFTVYARASRLTMRTINCTNTMLAIFLPHSEK